MTCQGGFTGVLKVRDNPEKELGSLNKPREVHNNIPAPSYYFKEQLTTEEAVAFIGISRSYLYKLVHQNKIPHYKPFGGKLYFKQSELENFIFRNKKAADYEVSDTANEILNGRETNRVHSQRKKMQGKK
jgi:excisionase family DNA binding protein